ncbi:MAG: hypothetical protein ACR2O4_06935, partial [Hyphomicrobiaceae bacterium]
QNRLARLYTAGLGVEESRIEAAKWHLLARAKGVSDFKLDVVISKLSAEDRAEAEQQVAAWNERVMAPQ